MSALYCDELQALMVGRPPGGGPRPGSSGPWWLARPSVSTLHWEVGGGQLAYHY